MHFERKCQKCWQQCKKSDWIVGNLDVQRHLISASKSRLYFSYVVLYVIININQSNRQISRGGRNTFFRMSQWHKTLFATRSTKTRDFRSLFIFSPLGFASCGKNKARAEKNPRVFELGGKNSYFEFDFLTTARCKNDVSQK